MENTEIWKLARNILLVRLDSLGDVLMSVPAIRAVRQTLPLATITLLTSSEGSAVTPLIPQIDKTITFDAPWVKNPSGFSASTREFNSVASKLRRQFFDAAIIFTVYSQNPLPAALLCFLANIPLRLGYCHENPYQLLNYWVPDPEPQVFIRHEVERQLALVKQVGLTTDNQKLAITVPEEAVASVKEKLSNKGVSPKSFWILLHPGASDIVRRYDPQKYIEAAKTLSKITQATIVVTGKEDEKDLVDSIAAGVGKNAVSFSGKLNLDELVSLISLSPLVITNNTGPAHIAAATNTPLVCVYGHTNPQHTPWMAQSRVLPFDVPCKACIRGICPIGTHPKPREVSPDEIVHASLELLNQTGKGISSWRLLTS